MGDPRPFWEKVERTFDYRTPARSLEPWELLGLLGLAIIRAGEERFGHHWEDEPNDLEKALRKLREADGGSAAEIDIAQLVRGLVVAAGGGVAGGLQILDAAVGATSWKWRIGFADGRGRKDQDAEIQALLHAVNALIMRMQKEYGRRLLLVVDGIDRVQEPERLDLLFVDSSSGRDR